MNEMMGSKPTEDEFEELLKQYFCDDDDDETVDDDMNDDEVDDEEVNEEENDDQNLDDLDFDNDLDDLDLKDFPDGSIKLSENNTVKVEVLTPVAHPREELAKLVGCQNIKSQISDLLDLTAYNHWMFIKCPEWKWHDVSLHAIFFGRPGTGKTTVCKIYGALLHEAGALSKGHVVVCNRGTFLGTSWGDEERAVRQVLEMAEGGVLMIDEAYLLNSPHPNDPGKLVIQLLMEILANEKKRDIAIVLCGYKEPMQKLLDLNQGLASRFPNRYEFSDFTVDELMEITRRRVGEHKYHFTRNAWTKYKSLLTEAYAARDADKWGNARYVANLLDHIYLLHAKRCIRKSHLKISQCFCITTADVQPIEVPKAKKRVGF